MSQPSKFRDSAAVVLVRGAGEALETFLVRRSEAVPYMPGFHAFVGGKVNADDAELPLAGIPGVPEMPAEMLRLLVACAVRETFEETGVLVGLREGAPPTEEDRDRMLAGEVRFQDLASERGWQFDASSFLFAGRWQTPPFAHIRFDTSFFVARLAQGEAPSIRPGELDQGEWIRPKDALAEWRHGRRTFAAPILWTLIALAEGEEDLAERLPLGPRRSRTPVRRIELKWGIVLHPMKTRPLPPATHTNAFLVGEQEMALIDPGSDDRAELDALFEVIEALGADGRRLKLVLVTHHHADHAGGVAAVRERYGVKVAAHPATAQHVACDFSIEDRQWIPLASGVGEWNLQALHTPGHAQGHLCFLHLPTRSLFTGDHIPGGRGTVIIDPPEGDMRAYMRSLEGLLEDPIDTLFPGHGSPQGGAKRRIRGLLEHRLKREAKVLAALQEEPHTLRELVETAYDDTKQELWGYAERSLLAHLLKLESEGRAARRGNRWMWPGADAS